MTLCLVTDGARLSPDARTPRDRMLALARWLEQAVAAGIDLIQLRERDLSACLNGDLARAVMSIAERTPTRVVVNDRADVALAADCHGVHLRGDGPPVARVRQFGTGAARSWVVGRSVHTLKEAAEEVDADYVMFGAVFASGPKPARGLATLRAVVSGCSRPVMAIGGLTVPRAAECLAAGATGVAAISLFLPPGRAPGALGVSEGVAALRQAIDAAATSHLQ